MPSGQACGRLDKVAFGDVVRQVRIGSTRSSPGWSAMSPASTWTRTISDIRRWGDIGDGYLGPASTCGSSPGMCSTGRVATYLRKVAVADFEGIYGQHDLRARAQGSERAVARAAALHHADRRVQPALGTRVEGLGEPLCQLLDLAWYEFALPPIEEQRRHCSALIRVDSRMRRGQRIGSRDRWSDLA